MERVRCHPEQPGSHKQLVRIVELRVLSAGVARRDNKKTVAQTLSAAGHTIRFA